MVTVPKKVSERIKMNLKKYQKILANAYKEEIKESNTVIIINDMLADIFGYEKYTEITAEYIVKSTYVDLAIKIDDEPYFLIEVKKITHKLKKNDLNQAVNYAANKGVDWAILTNGIDWEVYRMTFGKPVRKELVVKLNMLDLKPTDNKTIEQLFLLSKEGIKKSAIEEFNERKQTMNKYIVSALIQSNLVIHRMRLEMEKMHPGIKINDDNLRDLIVNEILKGDVIEGEKATDASKRIDKYYKSLQKQKEKKMAKKKTPENHDILLDTTGDIPSITFEE